MKLAVLANLLGSWPLEKALEYFASLDIHSVEIACGGYPGKDHADPEILLSDESAYKKFQETLKKYDFEVAALACHTNCVHPDPEVAALHRKDFDNAIRLAEKMGVDTVVTFSGCPGDCENSKYPNWVTCPWPDDFLSILKYQWDDVLIPYWQKETAFAKEHGVNRIALEMHPGFCVYNPETCLKLRAAVGDVIGANFDPSHLFWQGIDPVAGIRYLGDAIYHFHAKDTRIDPINTAKNGVLDTKHYGDEINRSWVFRSVGYGHSEETWRDIASALRLVGYDKVMSIEHEDSLMTPLEGLEKAVEVLKRTMIFEPKPTGMRWA